MPCDELEYPNLVDVKDTDVSPGAHFAVPVDASHKLFFFNGTICYRFQGSAGAWRRYLATVLLPQQGPEWVAFLADVDPEQNRVISEYFSATVHLASISNGNTAVNAGWAVDSTRIRYDSGRIALMISLAVRDSDGYINRMTYALQVLGRTAV